MINNKKTIFQAVLVLNLALALTGCHSNDGNNAQVSDADSNHATCSQRSGDYGDYYLYLKTLSSKDFLAEIERQKVARSQGEQGAQMRITLLYSLPQSPIYNVYSAKTVLNKALNKVESEGVENTALMSKNNAFVALLKDQLNQQIRLIEQIKVNNVKENDDLISNNKIIELENKVIELSIKIEQLRDIEKNISSQGY